MPLDRKQLFAVHGWLGMNFGLLLALICLSGTFATLTHEIEWATQPALRIEPDGPVQWEETYEALQQAHPEMHVGGLSRGEMTVLDGVAWTAFLSAPDGRWKRARVDPYDAEVVRPGARLYLADYMRQLHYNFFWGLWGWSFYLVCFISLPLLLSVVSGLLFYKRWWRHLFRLELGKGLHAFWSSLHRLLGVWSLIFGLIIGITGLWYLAEAELVSYDVAYPSGPTVSADTMAKHGPTPEPLSLGKYVDAATEAFPALEPTGISLPSSPDGTVRVEGNAGEWLVRDRANSVFLDPYSGEVVDVRRPDQLDALSWWVQAADSLHFGYWGGLASKFLWAFLGLCLPVSVLSGAYLSWRRAGVIGGRRQSSAPTRPWWRRYPIRVWILVPLLLYLTWSCVQGYIVRQKAAPPTAAVADTTLGPWRATVERETTVYPGRTTDYFVRLRAAGDGVASYKQATLGFAPPDRENPEGTELSGAPRAMSASLPTPDDVGTVSHLVLTVEGWDGTTYQTKLPSRVAEAPVTVLSEGESKPRHTDLSTGPAAPWTFFGMVGLYALLSFGLVGGWVVYDRRPPATSSKRSSNERSSDEPSPSSMADLPRPSA